LEDKSGKLPFSEISSDQSAQLFQKSNGKVPNYNFTSSTIWMRFRCDNQSSQALTYFFEVENYLLAYVNFYIADSSGQYRKYPWGTQNDDGTNTREAHNQVYPLRFASGKSTMIYVEVYSPFIITLPVYLTQPETFWEQFSSKRLFLGILYGVLIFALIYNFFLFIGLRDRNYLLYCGTIVCAILTNSIIDGFSLDYYWRGMPVWNVRAVGVLTALAVILSLNLSVSFLNLRTTNRLIYTIIRYGMLPFYALVLVANAFGIQAVMNLTLVLTLPYTLVTLLVTFRAILRGDQTARFYFASWFALLFGKMFIVMMVEGIVSYNFYNAHGLLIGTCLEVMLISFALADRYRIINREKNEARRNMLKAIEENARLIKEQNVILEQKVTERTHQLIETNEEITQQRDELAAQADQIAIQRDQLNDAFVRLKELDEFKEAFAGMIVHDLKNPLNAIIGISHKQQVSDHDRLVIRQASKQMLNLTLNILDVQKFEQAEVPLNLRNHPLAEIINDAIDQVSLLASDKNLHLTVSCDASLGVHADFELISRVLMNLLTNAIKYTPNNGSISIIAEKTDDKYLKIQVSDTGQGIPADKLRSVFDKFSQVEAKKSGSARSTGLGLTFCKMVIEAHGGIIGVISEFGVGTTFYFTLPLSHQTVQSTSIINHQAEIILSDTEKAYLRTYLPQLSALDVYEGSEVIRVLNQIETSDTSPLGLWKQALHDALFTSNQERYNQLVKTIA
jgi:signal transduction histidine kinase